MKMWPIVLAVGAALLNSACAVYPKKSEDFERPTCEVYHNPLTLDMLVLDKIDCGNSSAGACLFAYAAFAPVTAVASGSAVLAGNGLYWLGNRSHCSIKAYARRLSKSNR